MAVLFAPEAPNQFGAMTGMGQLGPSAGRRPIDCRAPIPAVRQIAMQPPEADPKRTMRQNALRQTAAG
jgi:hypothetical protein